MKQTFENLQGELLLDYPLSRHTSWRAGGAAERCYRPKDLQDLAGFLRQLPMDEPLCWLGLGSNVLIRDAGILGTVILTLNRLNQLTLIDKNVVRVEAGVTCAKLAKFCVAAGFEDGAFFAGIPGTVGGALAMNAGAFGGETWCAVQKVETINRLGEIKTRLPSDFCVKYREVLMPPQEYFVAGHFCFKPGDPMQAKKNITALLKKRNATQPIGTYSCGSVFRNPQGNFAARLIESAGLKGYAQGEVQVSDKHANFILNKGKATATEIENFIHYVATRVWEQHGIKLIPEVHIIGRV